MQAPPGTLYSDWELLEQHRDEATFLWLQWERSLVAPDYVLEEVAELEERLLAHVDGLVLGGPRAAEHLVVPALESEEQEVVATLAYVLLSPELPSGSEVVRTALEAAPPALLPAFQRALELRGYEVLPSWLPTLLEQDEPARQALALEVFASHAMHPGPMLAELLRHEEPTVAAAALRLATRLRQPLERDVLQSCLCSPVTALRDAALEAGVQAGYQAAWRTCREAVEAGGSSMRHPALLLALGGAREDEERLEYLLAYPHHRADALWALGFSGRVSAAEACLEWLEDKAVSQLAAEAFCATTGLTLQGHLLAPPVQEESLPPLEQDDLDADLTPKPEDELPRPAAAQVRAWWESARKQFNPGERYLSGRPFTLEGLYESLLVAPMRRRHVLALDLLLRSQGSLRVPTTAFTAWQRRALSAVHASVRETTLPAHEMSSRSLVASDRR